MHICLPFDFVLYEPKTLCEGILYLKALRNIINSSQTAETEWIVGQWSSELLCFFIIFIIFMLLLFCPSQCLFAAGLSETERRCGFILTDREMLWLCSHLFNKDDISYKLIKTLNRQTYFSLLKAMKSSASESKLLCMCVGWETDIFHTSNWCINNETIRLKVMSLNTQNHSLWTEWLSFFGLMSHTGQFSSFRKDTDYL